MEVIAVPVLSAKEDYSQYVLHSLFSLKSTKRLLYALRMKFYPVRARAIVDVFWLNTFKFYQINNENETKMYLHIAVYIVIHLKCDFIVYVCRT